MAVINIAIIQARMGSSRLPGKILMDLAGLPVLGWVVRAAQAVIGIDRVIVATTTGVIDDPVVSWCLEEGIDWYRGPVEDVLDRYAGAIASMQKRAEVHYVMRLTADCPFLDPVVCAEVLALAQISDADYSSNVDPPTWPQGLDCEVMRASALLEAANEALLPAEREHVTLFIRFRRDRYKVRNLVCGLPDLMDERWTLDTDADLAALSAIAKRISGSSPPSYLTVLNLVRGDHQLRHINWRGQREAGVNRSWLDGPPRDYQDFSRSQALRLASPVTTAGRENEAPFLSHGIGGKVWDVDGNEYVDLALAPCPILLGYADSDVTKAVREQLDVGCASGRNTALEVAVAKRLVDAIPCIDSIWFGESFREALDAVIALVQSITGKPRIAIFCPNDERARYIEHGVPDAHFWALGNMDTIRRELCEEERFAAVIIEPSMLEKYSSSDVEELRVLAHACGTLVVFDESASGFRVAVGGAQEFLGVTPDLAIFDSAIGNGFPISVIGGKAEIMQRLSALPDAAPSQTSVLALAAAAATIDKIRGQDVIESLWDTGNQLTTDIQELLELHRLTHVLTLAGPSVRTQLMFSGVSRPVQIQGAAFLKKAMRRRGVLTGSHHNLCHGHDDGNLAVIRQAYDLALGEFSAAWSRGNMLS